MAIGYVTRGATASTGSGMSLSPALPATTAGILVCMVTTYSVQAHSCSTPGWAQVSRRDSASQTTTIWVSNNGAAPTFTWGSAAPAYALIAQYNDTGSNLAYGVATGNSGGPSDAATVAGINSTENSTIALVIVSVSGNVPINTPSGWTNNFFVGGGSISARALFYTKALATSGTAAGVFTSSAPGFGANWTANMFEIKPPPAARRRQSLVLN